MINKSNYKIRSNLLTTLILSLQLNPGGICSCPDYACHNMKCKHVYAVEFYRSQSATFDALNQAVR